MDFVTYIFFLLLVTIIGITPFFLLYRFADFVYFMLYRIIGYRKPVVSTNLKKVFPDKTEKELKQIEKASYRNLADIFVEGIKGFTMSKQSIMKRHKFLNPEIFETYYKNNQAVIIAAGHYGNWEWGAFSAAYFTNNIIVGLYKPLSNKYMDGYAIRSRSKAGTILVPVNKTAYYFEQYAHKPSVFLMAGDQNPSNLKKAVWVDFMGIDTAFLHGIEFYAIKYNLPVLFLHMHRVKRGMYEYSLEIVVENPAEVKPGDITRIYAEKLEAMILDNPGDWLWSHKRWKHSR